MRFLLILRYLAWVCLLLPIAQGASGQEEQTERGRRAWFVASSIPEQVDNPMLVLAGGEVHEVTLSRRMVSNSVRIPRDGLIRVVRVIDNPEDPGEPAYQTLAAAQVAEGVSQALVILVPGAQQTEDGRVFRTSVQDLAGFQGGDYMFLNLSPMNVAIQMGDDRKAVQPGRREIFAGPRRNDPVNTPISYYYQDRAANQWRLISASTVVRMPTRREICIFSWDPRFERISYHGVTFPVSP